MIQRALRLQLVIQDYLRLGSTSPVRHFALTSDEWRQLEYLCDLLSPFYVMTTTLSELDGPAVHQDFQGVV